VKNKYGESFGVIVAFGKEYDLSNDSDLSCLYDKIDLLSKDSARDLCAGLAGRISRDSQSLFRPCGNYAK